MTNSQDSRDGREYHQNDFGILDGDGPASTERLEVPL